MISPASKDLFYRAIRQSGSALNYWTIYRNSKAQAQYFAKRVNCPTENSQKMADCLQTLDLYSLLEGHSEMLVNF
jgi:bile salt-stimulated lipase